ncbi:MAG: lactoylglutathione lyase [Myxococcota bacterium]|jgi:lactoylglutathione lyase
MKLGYTIFYVPDVPAALAFYEAAFGLKVRFVTDEGDYGELETGATVLAFAGEALAGSHGFSFDPQRPPHRPAMELALVTDDVQAAYDRALTAGATSLAAPSRKPWGQEVCYVSDLNGFTVEICTPVGG